jgi:hypothetical protein
MEWLMSTDVMGAFDEVYMKTYRYGYGTPIWSSNMFMNYVVNVGISLMDG